MFKRFVVKSMFRKVMLQGWQSKMAMSFFRLKLNFSLTKTVRDTGGDEERREKPTLCHNFKTRRDGEKRIESEKIVLQNYPRNVYLKIWGIPGSLRKRVQSLKIWCSFRPLGGDMKSEKSSFEPPNFDRR